MQEHIIIYKYCDLIGPQRSSISHRRPTSYTYKFFIETYKLLIKTCKLLIKTYKSLIEIYKLDIEHNK